jgi:hypothetical protein
VALPKGSRISTQGYYANSSPKTPKQTPKDDVLAGHWSHQDMRWDSRRNSIVTFWFDWRLLFIEILVWLAVEAVDWEDR